MTDRSTLWDDYLNKIKALNAVVRGWANYYRAVNAYAAFRELDEYVWLRLGMWLAKKYQCGPREVKRKYMQRQTGPQGGIIEYAAQDETGQWLWRYRATQTPLIYYRPSFKQHWPNPYLEKLTVELYELPSLKTMWTGYSEAPVLDAARREVLHRAKGHCERCGKKAKLNIHHQHRVNRGYRSLEQADHRPTMLEALCSDCHTAEHRAENTAKGKQIWTRHANRVNAGGAPVAG